MRRFPSGRDGGRTARPEPNFSVRPERPKPSGQMLAALVLASMPPRPALRSLPLPAKLAGGLFLFKTSVPAADKPFAGKLLAEAQQALRDDPRVTMELGAVSDRHSRTRVSPL